MNTGIYAGTFDVLHYGHIDVIKKMCSMFEDPVVLIANNPDKTCMFNPKERMRHLHEFMYADRCEFAIHIYGGLTADFVGVRISDQKFLIRGIRNTSDMLAEMQLADTNRELCGVDTIFIPTSNKYRNVSSSLVKELRKHGRSIHNYVPWYVEKEMIYKTGDKYDYLQPRLPNM